MGGDPTVLRFTSKSSSKSPRREKSPCIFSRERGKETILKNAEHYSQGLSSGETS